MNWQWLCLVAVGGASGTVARGIISMLWQSRFPWATLVINVLGSFLIGWLMARLSVMEAGVAARWHALLATGFCGGFTTFSAFSWQTLDQINKGQMASALANVVASVGLCLLAVWLGFRLGGH